MYINSDPPAGFAQVVNNNHSDIKRCGDNSTKQFDSRYNKTQNELMVSLSLKNNISLY